MRTTNSQKSEMECFKPEKSVPIPTKDILSWIFDNQKYNQDKPIYIDATHPSRSITSRQAGIIIQKLIAGLRAAGVKPGDCVCIHSFNDIYYSILVLAIIGIGGVFTGTNPAYTAQELTYHLRVSKATLIITEPEVFSNIMEAATACHIPKTRMLIFNPLNQPIPLGYISWQSLLQHGEQDWVRFDDETQSKNTTAGLFFSSGTTGLPKAAIISHYNFVAQHTLTVEVNGLKPYEIRKLHTLPMFHMAAAPSVHFAPLRSVHISYVMRRFELESYLKNVEEFKITELLVVPPLSIRQVSCGAAPLDLGLQERFRELLAPCTKLTQVYGMTETTCVATMFRWNEDDRTASVGRLIPNTEAMLIDDDDKNISGYGVRGELCIRGPCVIKGYYENPSANRSSFTDRGWLKTGDIAYCSPQTKLWYIVDRKKELIKVRGFQVAPLEIEAVLLNHPGVADVAVIGITPHPDGGELPRAYIVRRPGIGDGLTGDEVMSLVDKKLAKYKKLEGGVRFVASIPKNATGKILKRVLKEDAQAELKAKQLKL